MHARSPGAATSCWPCSRHARTALPAAPADGAAGDSLSRATSARIRETRTEWWYVTGALEPPARAHVRLPGHLLSLAHRRRRRPPEPLRGEAARVRARRADRPRAAAACATTSASRAPASASPTPARATPTCGCATGARAQRRRRAQPLPRALPATAARLRASTSRSRATQPLLLQGEAGLSRKGPRRRRRRATTTASRSSQARGTLALDGRRTPVRGRAWLDHEWSDALLHRRRGRLGLDRHEPRRRRRADGVSPAPRATAAALWAGGSSRAAGGALRDFAPDEVRFVAGRRWRSPRSQAATRSSGRVDDAGRRLHGAALLDDQELDSRGQHRRGLLGGPERPARRAAAGASGAATSR